ncbi:serine-rich adhesin for platelets-like isoform X2 [Watersipora subatra]|uniref:serine-rich adhesin for platelets-like isoform X2 n=1 Tax=Watersipora subatra TaxID=2589382 RepID=UPI00355C4CFC
MKAIIQSKTQNSSVAIEGVSPGSRHTTSFERSSTTYSLNSAGQTRRDQGGQTQGGQTQGGQTQGGQTPGGQTQGGQGGEFRHRYHSGEPTQSTSNMMSGLPQTPDFNFNDIYTSRMGTTRMDLDPYDNRMAWDNNSMTLVLSQHSGGHEQIITEGASHLPLQGVSPMQTDSSGLIALESKSHMQSVTSFNSYQSQTAPMSQSAPNGKLRELLSSVGTTSDVAAADASCLSPSHRKSPNQSGARLRKLLGTEEEGDFAKMDLSFSLRVNNSASLTSTDVTALTTSSPTSTSSKGTDQYQLLKKLLSEESRSEENERSEQDSILQKLFKQDENGVEKKSLSALSPDSSGVSSTRRHNSGGSSKDSKASSEDISARGTKRKISSSSAPLLPTSTAQTTACHDTSASTALLTHLLTKPLDNLTKVEACEITATPLEKRKAQKNKSNQSCNVVDVIDNKIMHGTEQINMERFTAIDSMVDATNYHRQNSGIYANGAVYSGHQVQQASSIVPDAPLTDMPRVPEQPLADMSGVTSYISNDSKDFFHSNLPPSLSSRSRPPMDFAESNRFENMESNSSASVLQHLLSPDSDNLIIQELENLLGGDTSMQLTSPEDEKAIKDIEKQLLYGTESFPGAPSEPHSPGFSLGLTNVPASASNPARATAIYNIHHKPQMSSMSSSHNMQSYDGPSHAGTQQQSGLRSHLQQGMVRPGMTSMRATHKSLARQGSGPAISSSRSLSQSAEVKIRRRSGNSPSSFSPLSTNQLGQKVQNNYPIPSNFGELMKSTDPPPNVKLPQDLNSNTFGLRTSDRIRHDGSTPHTSRVQGPASFSHSPMDLPSSPQHFRFPDQFGTGARGAPQRPLLGGQATGSYHAEHLNFLPSQQQMSNKGDLHSPQTIRSGPMENPGNTLTSTVHPLSSGTQANLPNLPQYSHVNQASSNSVSNSQFVKQDLKAVITARAQKQIASPQNQKLSKQHVMGMMSPSAAQNSSMSSEPFSTQFSSTPVSAGKADDDSVLPDDILDQITELTDTQNEIQQNHIDSIAKSNSIPDEVPMTTSGNAMITNEHDLAVQHLNQYKKDYTALRNEYRELVGDTSHQSQGALGQVFRKQLSKSKQKNNLKSPTEPLKSEKLKQHTDNTPVNVITMEPRPPIQEMQPNDQRGSVLLLQLLTEDVVT